jgi:probable HAF family extracellular repeat protein
MQSSPRLLVIVPVLALAAPLAAAPPLYRITDLGTLGGTQSQASAINDNGDIAGTSLTTGDAEIRAFLYSNGVMQPLGTLSGGDTYGNGINNARLVVGDSQVASGDPHGYWTTDRLTLHDVGTLGGPGSIIWDVNNAGDMVGQSDVTGPTPDDIARGFLYRNGQFTTIGTFGGPYSAATAINDKGQVAGYAAFPKPPDPLLSVRDHAFLWENGTLKDLGTLPGDTHSEAYALNEKGQVVGTSETALGPTRAFLYDTDGTIKPLGNLPGGTSSFAAGINDAGVTVGDAFIDPDNTHAFVWMNGTMYDLNVFIDDPNSPWELTSAGAVNNGGVIVGVGTINGEEHAFVATPIPEPLTILPAIAVVALIKRRRLSRPCQPKTSAPSERGSPADPSPR